MIPSCKELGCVQKMMGHSSLIMIRDKYFYYIPNRTHNDGSKFLTFPSNSSNQIRKILSNIKEL